MDEEAEKVAQKERRRRIKNSGRFKGKEEVEGLKEKKRQWERRIRSLRKAKERTRTRRTKGQHKRRRRRGIKVGTKS